MKFNEFTTLHEFVKTSQLDCCTMNTENVLVFRLTIAYRHSKNQNVT